MRLKNYHQHKKPELMIIPMIDIIFFLLVFFMISMLSMVMQQGLSVNLPQAAATQKQTSKNIVLTITKEKKLYFDKEEIALKLLGTRLQAEMKKGKQTTILINADKEARHGWVVEVMDQVKRAGISKLAVATEDQ